MAINNSALWKSVAFSVTISVFIQLIYSWYIVRLRVHRLRKRGLAMPPWNWLTGHSTFIRAYARRYPSDILANVVLLDLYRDYFTDSEMFYLDLWPTSAPILVICNAKASYDVNRKLNNKPDVYIAQFDPQSGGPSLLSTNGNAWKHWRALLNPGFAPGYLAGKIGELVDGSEIFNEILSHYCIRNEIFELENATMRLTMETIMKITLNDHLNYQKIDHPVPEAMRTIIFATSIGGFNVDRLNPIRAMKIWKCNRIINHHFAEEIKRRHAELISHTGSSNQSMMSMAIALHLSQKYPNGAPQHLDAGFIREAIPQVRMLLIAGHDTTTSILVYCYHLLAKYPGSLEKLREEHTAVFGSDPSDTSSILRSPDGVKYLSRLPYTSGVIKEALRLYPPGGAIRTGSPTVQVSDPTGILYPTEGCLVALQHHAIHRNPRIYPNPDIFDPNRWLGGKSVVKGAFRPFEHGARNCIGQDIAYMLLKITLVTTARRYVVTPAYENHRQKCTRYFGFSARAARRIDEVHGEKAYQTEKGGTHPALSYPCRVDVVSS